MLQWDAPLPTGFVCRGARVWRRRLESLAQPTEHGLGNQPRDVPAPRRDLLHETRGEEGVLGVRGDEQRLDALVYPTLRRRPARIGDVMDPDPPCVAPVPLYAVAVSTDGSMVFRKMPGATPMNTAIATANPTSGFAPLVVQFTGSSSVQLLPLTTILQAGVFAPIATLAVYDIGARVAGRPVAPVRGVQRPGRRIAGVGQFGRRRDVVTGLGAGTVARAGMWPTTPQL